MIIRFRLLFLLAFVIFMVGCEPQNTATPDSEISATHQLIYTKHARCRMQCRQVSEQEVQEIIASNHINTKKSNPNDNRCPTYAYEGYSQDKQHLRIIIAKCQEAWKVVTCIDLENEFACNCK